MAEEQSRERVMINGQIPHREAEKQLVQLPLSSPHREEGTDLPSIKTPDDTITCHRNSKDLSDTKRKILSNKIRLKGQALGQHVATVPVKHGQGRPQQPLCLCELQDQPPGDNYPGRSMRSSSTSATVKTCLQLILSREENNKG